MKKIYCDRCGKEITSTSEYVDGHVTVTIEYDLYDRANIFSLSADLCTDCGKEAKILLKKFIEAEGAEP